MESLDVASKKKVLVETLTACLERSKVGQVVTGDTLRLVLSSAATEMWREGEFRLEYVWKILCQQPGLTPQDIAPALAAFKTTEAVLDVEVQLPTAFAQLSEEDLRKYAAQIGLDDAVLHPLITSFRDAALRDRNNSIENERITREQKRHDAETPEPEAAIVVPVKGKQRNYRKVAYILSAITVVALGVSGYIAFGNTAKEEDLSEFSAILPLEGAKRDGASLVAHLADPSWDGLPTEQKQAITKQLFEKVKERGIQSMTLLDAENNQKVMASEIGGETLILIP